MLTAPAPDAADGRIIRRANTPREGLTTYYLPLEGCASGSGQSVLATVLLFDMAVVDGVVSPVRHNVTLIAVGGGGGGNATYKYEVEVEPSLGVLERRMILPSASAVSTLLPAGR
jgi:hypothetical protein